MAEEDPVEAIEKALGEDSEGLQDFERLAEIHLKQLQQDYEATLAADIPPEQHPSSDHSDSSEADDPPPEYQVCQSNSEDEDEWGELQAAEPSADPAPESEERQLEKNAGMSGDQIKRIKEAMRGLDLPPPAWAVGLSDETFLRFVSDRIT